MQIQQTVIDNPGYAPGWFWFPQQGQGYFCPPKTGFSSMSSLFPQNVEGRRPWVGVRMYGCIREPYDRFLSVFNMTVLNSYYRQNGWGRLAGGFDSAWLARWFPDPSRIEDPVAFARSWLTEAAPVLDHWGGDLHSMSQSRGYRNLLGQGWHRNGRMTLIPMHRWAGLIQDRLRVSYAVNNRAVYTVPRTQFASLRPLVYQTWPEDVQLYREACRAQG